MGGTSSTVIDLVYATRDRSAALNNLDGQLEGLRKEIQNRPQAITKGVAATISTLNDAVIMRYSQLQDTRVIEENVEKIFQKFPGREHVIVATREMIANMMSTKSKTLQGWQHRKKFKKHKGKSIGIEIHFKTEMFEDFTSRRSNRDTVVLIAYKCLAHMMDPKVNHGYLEVDQLSESMISMNIQDMSLEVSSYSYSRSSSSSSFRQQVLRTRQTNRGECKASCATGITPTADSDSDEDSCVAARSTIRPKVTSTSDEDSDDVNLPSKRESISDEDSADEDPHNPSSYRLRPHSRPSSAWPSTTRGHHPSLFGAGDLSSRRPPLKFEHFKGARDSFEW